MKIQQTSKFKQQLKKLAQKGYPIKTLKSCIEAIIKNDDKILNKIKNHHLSGTWKGYREFHPARIGNYGSRYDGWIVIY